MATVTTTRTNLATNPSFEAASGTVTVRTNFCRNPNFEGGISEWTAEGGAVLTQDTTAPISGTASGKIVGGDIYTMTPAAPGETWTFSLDYKTSGAVTGNPRLYLAGSSGANTMALPLNQTIPGRFSVTVTTPASTTQLIAAVFAPDAVSGHIWVDNILLEKSSRALPYFDGSTPITNRAINPDLAADSMGWFSGGTTTRVFEDGRWWATAPTGTWTYASATLRAGMYYATSLRVRGPAGTTFSTASTDSVYGNFATNNSYTIPASGEMVVQEPAAFYSRGTNGNFGVSTPSAPLKITEAYVELVEGANKPVTSSYYKGQGDFTYVWSGTANASSSHQQAPGVANIQSYWNADKWASYQSSISPLWGSKFWRAVATSASTFLYGTSSASGIPVTPGKTITCSFNVRPSITRSFSLNTGWDGPASTPGPIISCLANVWTRVSSTVVVPAGASLLTVYFNTEATSAAGDTYDFDGLLVEESDTAGSYFDGDTPEVLTSEGYSPPATRMFEWLGDSHASQSAERLIVPLQDYQVELPDGTIVGAGTSVGLLEITGLRSSGETRDTDFDRGGVDGMSPGISLLTGRTIGIKWLITDPNALEESLQKLSRNWQNIPNPSSVTMTARDWLVELANIGPRKASALKIQLPGRAVPLMVFGRPLRLSPPINSNYANGWVEVESEWKDMDGKTYDYKFNIDATTLANAGALTTFPWTFPVNFGPSTGGVLQLDNDGLYPAKPVFRVNGPVTNPMITDSATGKFVRVNLTLLSTDVLIIDTDSRVVRLNGVNRNNALDTNSSFFTVPPGGSTASFSSTDFGGNGWGNIFAYTLNTYSTA